VVRFIERAALAALAPIFLQSVSAAAQVPEAIAAPQGAIKLLEVHAEGAQIYECKAAMDGKLTWQFREPIAALMVQGKTVGRHYAGPAWELSDGSAVTGKVAAKAAGAAPGDIPLLRLDAVDHKGSGQLSGVTTIQRIGTKGGAAEGACTLAGALLSVPYSSTYVFLK
jgi:Protein of unknown function (DUF3455)